MSKSTAPAKWEEYADHFSPLEIEVTSSFEDAIRRFKSEVQKSKIISDYKERQYYEKPSARKRRKKREAIERERLLQLKERQMLSGEWDRKQKEREKKKIAKRRKRSEDRYE